ncbi:hypothetical protein H1R20_g2372, partial [Candolleomyces eurysporus]
MAFEIPPWPITRLSKNKQARQLERICQIQYLVRDDPPAARYVYPERVVVEPINTLRPLVRDWSEPVIIPCADEGPQSLPDAIRLVTKRQWLLALFYERRILNRGPSSSGLKEGMFETLVWYLQYYEKVIDAFFLAEPVDLKPLELWLEVESKNFFHRPDVQGQIDDDDYHCVDPQEMVQVDPWGIKNVWKCDQVSQADPAILEACLDKIYTWLANHDLKNDKNDVETGVGEQPHHQTESTEVEAGQASQKSQKYSQKLGTATGKTNPKDKGRSSEKAMTVGVALGEDAEEDVRVDSFPGGGKSTSDAGAKLPKNRALKRKRAEKDTGHDSDRQGSSKSRPKPNRKVQKSKPKDRRVV